MNLFQIEQGGLQGLEEKPFKLEKEIQGLFEDNLATITGLEFVSSEFSIQNQRLDTLAFDYENQSFVIMEYKRSTNQSVLDQGVSYLNTLLKYKADFILEYQEQTGKLLTKKDVDWSQSKVVFISPNFTAFQKQAVDFKDLNIELWEVKRFTNNVLLVNGVLKSANAPSIKVKTDQVAGAEFEGLREIVTYTEEQHFLGKSEEVLESYQEFRQAIIQLVPDIVLDPKKLYIAFKKNKKNIIDIEIQKKQLKLFINAKMGQIDDPKGLLKDVSSIGHRGNGDYQIIIKTTRNLEYIMSCIKQIL
ncbi:DUF5655 domain-containing protein [Streptococcus merionis]|uniref:Uncharacterized conserved protein n=1 Tax=Streptococcus merionis TaxID=400065 RepID=A0A239SWM6_9STRE|nr:DUF5655 domain-containing protein [Streptococcus merionis]SNU89649.1 Uncharacterized conserved protein [Streptococcus merionis]